MAYRPPQLRGKAKPTAPAEAADDNNHIARHTTHKERRYARQRTHRGNHQERGGRFARPDPQPYQPYGNYGSPSNHRGYENGARRSPGYQGTGGACGSRAWRGGYGTSGAANGGHVYGGRNAFGGNRRPFSPEKGGARFQRDTRHQHSRQHHHSQSPHHAGPRNVARSPSGGLSSPVRGAHVHGRMSPPRVSWSEKALLQEYQGLTELPPTIDPIWRSGGSSRRDTPPAAMLAAVQKSPSPLGLPQTQTQTQAQTRSAEETTEENEELKSRKPEGQEETQDVPSSSSPVLGPEPVIAVTLMRRDKTRKKETKEAMPQVPLGAKGVLPTSAALPEAQDGDADLDVAEPPGLEECNPHGSPRSNASSEDVEEDDDEDDTERKGENGQLETYDDSDLEDMDYDPDAQPEPISEEELEARYNPEGRYLTPARKAKLRAQTLKIMERERGVSNNRKRKFLPPPPEFARLRHLYGAHSERFTELFELRREARNNEYIVRFFDAKYKNQDEKSRSAQKHIGSLFRRFYAYAIDIDSGTNYTQFLQERVDRRQAEAMSQDHGYAHPERHNAPVYFLDFGFAPGGMCRLLLDCTEFSLGVGVTLPPEEKGNAIIEELYHDPRFLVRECCVTRLAKVGPERDQVVKALKLEKAMFPGFDLVVIGITMHQSFKDSGMVRLDHQILMSELYVGLQTLADGGGVLIRHKISTDLLHQHILYMFLDCFDTFSAHKPITEFAIRKTYWCLWRGFRRDHCIKQGYLKRLHQLLHTHPNLPPYGIDRERHCYRAPIMVPLSPDEMFETRGSDIVRLLDPMFAVQFRCLSEYCEGKRDRFCYRQVCSCNRAHSAEEMIGGFMEAKKHVDQVMRHEARTNRRSEALQHLFNGHRRHHHHSNDIKRKKHYRY